MNPFSLTADLTNVLNEEAVIATVPMVERLKNDGEPPFSCLLFYAITKIPLSKVATICKSQSRDEHMC